MIFDMQNWLVVLVGESRLEIYGFMEWKNQLFIKQTINVADPFYLLKC